MKVRRFTFLWITAFFLVNTASSNWCPALTKLQDEITDLAKAKGEFAFELKYSSRITHLRHWAGRLRDAKWVSPTALKYKIETFLISKNISGLRGLIAPLFGRVEVSYKFLVHTEGLLKSIDDIEKMLIKSDDLAVSADELAELTLSIDRLTEMLTSRSGLLKLLPSSKASELEALATGLKSGAISPRTGVAALEWTRSLKTYLTSVRQYFLKIFGENFPQYSIARSYMEASFGKRMYSQASGMLESAFEAPALKKGEWEELVQRLEKMLGWNTERATSFPALDPQNLGRPSLEVLETFKNSHPLARRAAIYRSYLLAVRQTMSKTVLDILAFERTGDLFKKFKFLDPELVDDIMEAFYRLDAREYFLDVSDIVYAVEMTTEAKYAQFLRKFGYKEDDFLTAFFTNPDARPLWREFKDIAKATDQDILEAMEKAEKAGREIGIISPTKGLDFSKLMATSVHLAIAGGVLKVGHDKVKSPISSAATFAYQKVRSMITGDDMLLDENIPVDLQDSETLERLERMDKLVDQTIKIIDGQNLEE
jgi:hypothetical protein